MWTSSCVALCLITAFAAACGGRLDTVTSDSGRSADAPVLETRCGAAVLPAGPTDAPIDAEGVAALSQIPAWAPREGFVDDYDWYYASRSAGRLVLFGKARAAPPPGEPEYAEATFVRENGAWKPWGWGECRLDVTAPGYGNAYWVLDPSSEPDGKSAQLPILINERACASGQPPVDREIRPVIDLAEDSVTITVLVEPVSGGADCPSNPWHPVIVDLGEPLGDRRSTTGAQCRRSNGAGLPASPASTRSARSPRNVLSRACAIVLAVTAVAAPSAGCGPSAAERDLEEARETWEEQELERYVIDISGGYGSGPARVVVVDGQVESVELAPDAPLGATVPEDGPRTVEDVFELVDSMLDRGASVAFTHDPETGLPAGVSITHSGSTVSYQLSLVEPVPGMEEAGARRCDGPPGSPTDVANEPTRGLNRSIWKTKNGCLVRVDIISDFQGPEHCDWESAHVIVTGRPIGVLYTSPQDGAWYVRDPEGVFRDPALVDGYDPTAELPDDAVDTTFRQADRELWVVPGDESAIYLKGLDGVERWPLDPTPLLCE